MPAKKGGGRSTKKKEGTSKARKRKADAPKEETEVPMDDGEVSKEEADVPKVEAEVPVGRTGIAEEGAKVPGGRDGPEEGVPTGHVVEDPRFKVLSRVLASIGTDFDLDVIAGNIVEHLKGLVRFERAALGLLDKPGEKMMVYVLYVDHASELDTGRPVKRRGTGMWQAVNERRPHICDDMAEEEMEIEESRILVGEGIRSYITFPLAIEDKVAGVVTLGSREPGAFDDSVIPTLEPFIALLSRSLQGSRLKAQLEDSISKMQVVDRASELAQTMEDGDEFLRKVLEEAQQAFGQFNFVFFEVDEKERMFKIREFQTGFQYNALKDYTQSLDDGILGKVYRTMGTWVVRDSRTQDGFIEAPNTVIGAEIAAPAVVNVRVRGLLSCITPHPFDFKSYEVWVVRQLAEIIGKKLYG